MSLKQDSKSEENCNLKPARAGHSCHIRLSSPNAPVLWPGAVFNGGPPLLGGDVTPYKT